MAVEVLQDVRVEINGVVLSDHAKRVTINYGANALSHNTMGIDTDRVLAGNKKWDMSVEFENDYAGGSVDATLWALVGAAPFTISVRKSSAATGPTNPQYSGLAILEGYPPIDVEQGNIPMAPARFLAAGTLARAVA